MTASPLAPGAHALNTFFDALSTAVVPNSCDVVVIAGRIDVARLRSAIAEVLPRHPILERAMRPSRGAPPPPPLPIDLRLHFFEDDDPATLDEHLLGLVWEEPFADASRPVRFHVTETPTRTYFQTIHTHVYADATACYLLTEEIAAAYAGASPPAARSGGLAVEALLDRRLVGRVKGWGRGLARTLRDVMGEDGALEATRALDGGLPGPRALSRCVLTVEETTRLRAAARARGVSIHALFQLAFLRAATDHKRRRGVDEPTLRLWDFFSLRPLLEAGASPRYDCLALIYPVELDARRPDREVLDALAGQIERMRGGELLEHLRRFDALHRLFGSRGRRGLMAAWPLVFRSDVFFTNPGVCPSRLEKFGRSEVLEYVTFPQLFLPATAMFIFSTFRDRLRILAISDVEAQPEFLRDPFVPFLERLGKLSGLDLGATRAESGFVARWTTPHRTSGRSELSRPNLCDRAPPRSSAGGA